jgi:ABC-type uncharacterized transport system substrate-binding protein
MNKISRLLTLPTETIDYYKLGHKSCEMTVKFFEGSDMKEINLEMLKNIQLIINKKVAKALEISLDYENFKELEII